jgi:hypothetical protein
MKKLLTFICCNLILFSVFAQHSGFENIRLKLSQSSDSLMVNYDLTGEKAAFNVTLDIKSEEGQQFYPRIISGDIGTICPGVNKAILWDMKNDLVNLPGKTLLIKVVGNIFIPEPAKKKIWIPWLYIASAACAATSIYAHTRVNRLYEDYNPSEWTDEAEDIHSEVVKMQNLRNVMAGAAGVLGAAGVVVHIRHIHKKKEAALSYIPQNDGGAIILTFNF